eukprot:gene25145-4329_t
MFLVAKHISSELGTGYGADELYIQAKCKAHRTHHINQAVKAGAAVYTGAQGHTWQAMAASQFANDHCTMFIAAFCAAGVLGLTTPPPPCDVGDVTGDAVIGVQLGDWCRAQRAHEIVVEALGMPFVDFVVNWIDNYDAGDA